MSTKGFAFSRELQLSQMCKRLLFDCAENFKVFNPLGRRCSTAVEWTPSEKNLRGRGFRSYRVLGFFSLSLSSTFCVLNKVLRGVATLLIFLILKTSGRLSDNVRSSEAIVKVPNVVRPKLKHLHYEWQTAFVCPTTSSDFFEDKLPSTTDASERRRRRRRKESVVIDRNETTHCYSEDQRHG